MLPFTKLILLKSDFEVVYSWKCWTIDMRFPPKQASFSYESWTPKEKGQCGRNSYWMVILIFRSEYGVLICQCAENWCAINVTVLCIQPNGHFQDFFSLMILVPVHTCVRVCVCVCVCVCVFVCLHVCMHPCVRMLSDVLALLNVDLKPNNFVVQKLKEDEIRAVWTFSVDQRLRISMKEESQLYMKVFWRKLPSRLQSKKLENVHAKLVIFYRAGEFTRWWIPPGNIVQGYKNLIRSSDLRCHLIRQIKLAVGPNTSVCCTTQGIVQVWWQVTVIVCFTHSSHVLAARTISMANYSIRNFQKIV